MKKAQKMYKILVVDDDSGFCEVTKIVLTDAGYDVQIEQDCIKTEEHIKKFNPDLVMIDQYLRRMLGTDIVTKLRKNGYKKPIIMASSDRSVRDAALKAGANMFFSKPYDIDDLIKAVKEQL